jgi:hypothetical protein
LASKYCTEPIGYRVNFFTCGPASKAETDRSHTDFWRDVHRLENGGQLDFAGMAGRTSGGGHSVELSQQLSADLTDKGDV